MFSQINLVAMASHIGSTEFWQLYETVAIYLASAISKDFGCQTIVWPTFRKSLPHSLDLIPSLTVRSERKRLDPPG